MRSYVTTWIKVHYSHGSSEGYFEIKWYHLAERGPLFESIIKDYFEIEWYHLVKCGSSFASIIRRLFWDPMILSGPLFASIIRYLFNTYLFLGLRVTIKSFLLFNMFGLFKCFNFSIRHELHLTSFLLWDLVLNTISHVIIGIWRELCYLCTCFSRFFSLYTENIF